MSAADIFTVLIPFSLVFAVMLAGYTLVHIFDNRQ